MPLLIASTFSDSLAKLTVDEQKLVKTTAFDLQLDPKSPGLSWHRIEQSKDKDFWSVRASSDLRVIVHRSEDRVLLCYVDHHDKAYAWAERRRVETHPTTGAAQLVELRETVREVVLPVYVPGSPAPRPKRKLFENVSEERLLGYGVPADWLEEVRGADEDSVLNIAEHLPSEAAEALLALAVGAEPKLQPVAPSGADPFAHPDAQRRFRVLTSIDELRQALDYPWEKWTVFLHPDQRQTVERDYNGPARVGGSAGTGKTIVALHRAVTLARRHLDARVLLSTYSEPLANALMAKLKYLLSSEPRLAERIDVEAIDAVGLRLHQSLVGPVRLAGAEQVAKLLDEAGRETPPGFPASFVRTEWDDVVDPWQLTSWEAYRDVKRLGRKTRISEAQRRALWAVFERVQAKLASAGVQTLASVYTRLAQALVERVRAPYDFAVIDEAQDLGVAALRFLAALGGARANALFFAGDQGQRIFQTPFSWKALGIDVRGRSRSLQVNYRTSHQIRTQADRLLDAKVSDLDGNEEERDSTVSVFNGPQPQLHAFLSEAAERDEVARWLMDRTQEGYKPSEMGVFVRSLSEIPRAAAAVAAARLQANVLDEHILFNSAKVSVSTMHLAKGLEFRAVVVMACDDTALPCQTRIDSVSDEAELAEVYKTERHLLYVACTRARDQLFVSGVKPVSEFLADLG